MAGPSPAWVPWGTSPFRDHLRGHPPHSWPWASEWPGSVQLQGTHHDTGFEGNLKGPGSWEGARTPVCSTLAQGQDCLGTSSN